jgi:hypothetical protein
VVGFKGTAAAIKEAFRPVHSAVAGQPPRTLSASCKQCPICRRATSTCCEHLDVIRQASYSVPKMWSFIVLCVFLLGEGAYSEDDLKVFRKCCPNGQSLIKFSEFSTIPLLDTYECIDSVYVTSDINITNTNSHLSVDATVLVEHGIPKECDLQMVHVSDMTILSMQKDICYDRLIIEITNGTIQNAIPKNVALKCNDTEHIPEVQLQVKNIRKCCPKGQVYDTVYHWCRDDDNKDVNSEGLFIERIKKERTDIYEIENGLDCKFEEYSVELKEGIFSFSLEDSVLNVVKKDTKAKNKLSKGNWCIDQEYSTKRLMARVCTRDCDNFDAFCMRKCCPLGHHYLPLRCTGAASRCVPNTEDSVYFNLSQHLDPLKSKT